MMVSLRLSPPRSPRRRLSRRRSYTRPRLAIQAPSIPKRRPTRSLGPCPRRHPSLSPSRLPPSFHLLLRLTTCISTPGQHRPRPGVITLTERVGLQAYGCGTRSLPGVKGPLDPWHRRLVLQMVWRSEHLAALPSRKSRMKNGVKAMEAIHQHSKQSSWPLYVADPPTPKRMADD
jgi:hypothetical protein